MTLAREAALIKGIATAVRTHVERVVKPFCERIAAVERENAALTRRVAELEDHITKPTP